MSVRSEIDEALRLLGNAPPPPGLERRINLRLQSPRSHFSIVQAFLACAVAASIVLFAVALNPTLRRLVFPQHSAGTRAIAAPRVVTPAAGGFGTASAVHVPVEPVPVQPTPVTQGRGRSRSGRAVLPDGNLAPLPRGVAAPRTISPDPRP
jgi:hypothetical protein